MSFRKSISNAIAAASMLLAGRNMERRRKPSKSGKTPNMLTMYKGSMSRQIDAGFKKRWEAMGWKTEKTIAHLKELRNKKSNLSK